MIPLRLAFLADPNSIHTRRWLAFFAGRGHDVHLLVGADQAVEPGLDPAIHLHRFVSYGRRFRPPGALRARRSLRRVLAAIDPDALHAHAVTRYGWLAWTSGFRPLVTTVWGTDVLVTARTSRPAKLLAWLVLRRSVMVTAVSADLGRAAVQAGADPALVRVVHFGVDLDRFAPGPRPDTLVRELGLERSRVVLSPRAVTPLYRHDIVLEAFAGLPEDTVLMLSLRSAAPSTVEGLQRLAAELGIADRLCWLPGIEHVAMPDHYRLADVVVSVPESDALAVTLLEAMASGVPIVASDLPSTREGLGEGSEWLVPVGDAAATGAALRRALALGPAERAALGATLRSKAIAIGDTSRNLTAMEDAYREIAAWRTAAGPADGRAGVRGRSIHVPRIRGRRIRGRRTRAAR